MKSELKIAMQKKLEEAGLGFESIQVFGAIRCNVHVKCVSIETANKWAILLMQVFKGKKATITKTIWRAADQSESTFLIPNMRKGYLITIAG